MGLYGEIGQYTIYCNDRKIIDNREVNGTGINLRYYKAWYIINKSVRILKNFLAQNMKTLYRITSNMRNGKKINRQIASTLSDGSLPYLAKGYTDGTVVA
jgi:hypothetical protein